MVADDVEDDPPAQVSSCAVAESDDGENGVAPGRGRASRASSIHPTLVRDASLLPHVRNKLVCSLSGSPAT